MTDGPKAVGSNKRSEPEQSRLRVLMVAPTSFFADYGCHVRILEEARVLQRRGHKVTIATYHTGRNLPDVDIQRTLPIPWRRDYEVGSSRHKLAFDALLGVRVLQLLMRQRFDIIHAHLHEGALIAQVLGGLFGIPVVFDFQGSLTEEMIDHRFLRRDSWLYPAVRNLEERIDRRAATVFTSSANAERILFDPFGCDPARICPLPDCVNTEVFVPAARQDQVKLDELRRSLGLPAGAKIVVYLGLLAAYQGTDLLLQAMAQVRQQDEDAYLLLMGFPGLDQYRQQAQALGIADRVILTGRIPYELAPLYLALGDVAVAPKLSLTESAGKLLNYMAVSLPTVAFDTPVAREYLGPHGVFAERGSAVSLAERLLALLGDEARRQQIGEQLRKRAQEQFEWNNAAHVIEAAYRTQLGTLPQTVEHAFQRVQATDKS
jgi:glycosyltransferase involved in cell wall biosynthesis